MAKSSDWNLRWQQDVNAIMNASQFSVPTKVFKYAVIDTFTVNYRDTLVSVGGVRNNMCKNEGYLLATTDSHNNRRLQEYQFDNTHNITNHFK
jgi:hypothetical protein